MVPNKLITEYQILFGIQIIQIPITNTTVRSNYLNIIQIPNYLSHPDIHPGLGVAKLRGLGGCGRGASRGYPGVHMVCIWGVFELYSLYWGVASLS